MQTTTPLLDTDTVFDDLDQPSMTTLLEHVSDVSLLVAENGRIDEVAVSSADLKADIDENWVGRDWSDTVTGESRVRLQELMKETAAGKASAWRDVVHELPDGTELPIRYCAVKVGGAGKVIAVGRDLRAVAALRQQLVNAQIALERDYWRLRQVETRYRLLFQMAADAVLVVDDDTGKVVEANPAAGEILGAAGGSLLGKTFPMGLDERGMDSVRTLMSEARAVGRGSAVTVRSADGAREFLVSANFLRQDSESRLLIRVSDAHSQLPASTDAEQRPFRLDDALRKAPDGVLVTDADGRVIAANDTFVALAQLANEDQAYGRSIDRWLGRTAVDLNVLLSNLRQRQVVRLFATTLRGDYGTSTEVEISASTLAESPETMFVFFIRDVGRRVSAEDPAALRLPRSVAQITQQVGRLPLKALVRQSTDVIEKLCIEAALELTGDNRASAAELLGLSRQSLYSKLRRHGIGDGVAGEEDDD